MDMKINLTKLLEITHNPSRPEYPTADASYLPILPRDASVGGCYSFELDKEE